MLVEQNGRVATLSPAGRVVAEAARRILSEIDQMQVQLENERRTVAGTLTLAAFATATRGVIPPALRTLRSDWPRLKCHLVEADSHGVAEYASQIAMVGAGLGVALVPRMGRGAVPDTVRVLPVVPAPTRQVYAVWRSLTGSRPALQAAVLALAESFSEALDPGDAGPGLAVEVTQPRSGRPALAVSSRAPGRSGLSAASLPGRGPGCGGKGRPEPRSLSRAWMRNAG